MRLQQGEHMRKFVECGHDSRLKIAHKIWRTFPPNVIAALIRVNLNDIERHFRRESLEAARSALMNAFAAQHSEQWCLA